MLMIRLQRVGRKNVPAFRVVLTDKRNSTKSGKYLEMLGSYNPRNDKEKTVDADRIKYWISKGAQPTGTMHNFLVDKKIISGKKLNVLPRKSPIKKEEVKKEETPASPAAGAEAVVAAEASASPVEAPAAPVETPKA